MASSNAQKIMLKWEGAVNAMKQYSDSSVGDNIMFFLEWMLNAPEEVQPTECVYAWKLNLESSTLCFSKVKKSQYGQRV